MRSATTVTAPVAFCTWPRIKSADAVCASCGAAPNPPRTKDVDHPGLILEVDEGDALRRRRPLAVGHRSRHQHPGPVGHLQQLVGRNDAERVEVLAQELGGIASGRNPRRPHVSGGQLEFGHAGQRRDLR